MFERLPKSNESGAKVKFIFRSPKISSIGKNIQNSFFCINLESGPIDNQLRKIHCEVNTHKNSQRRNQLFQMRNQVFFQKNNEQNRDKGKNRALKTLADMRLGPG